MKRRKKVEASSLELLLDTICNTFGGVLFLAILICVLLRATTPLEIVSQPLEQVTPAEMQQLETRLEELIADIETLQVARAQQEEIADQFRKPQQQAIFVQMSNVRAERDKLFQERLRTIGEIQKHHRHAAEVRARLEELTRNVEAAKKAIRQQQEELVEAQAEQVQLATAADELLKAIKAAQTRTAPLPRQRKSWKSEVGVVVRFNRLYVWHEYDRLGLRTGLNTDDFVVVEERDDGVVTMPKPYAGVPLTTGDAPARIAARLRPFDSQSVHLAVVIWDDSFDSFQTLKNTIVGLGFEYRLMPMAEGNGVRDRGGVNSRVQ